MTINNLRFSNACRTINNDIHKDHEQSNKKPILNKQNKNTFTVFHQNIQGLLNKKELLNSLTRNSPQIICIKEHHVIDEELEGITLHPFIPILWKPNFVDKRTNVGVCVYLFRIICTLLILKWIDTPMKRTQKFVL
jgi:hypothetical protein